MTSQRKRLIETILIAKGIGIILVVIGHYAPPTAPEYWKTLREIIYRFHMPLFFLLSGYLFSRTDLNLAGYGKIVFNKTKRLAFPFLSIAALIFLVKYFAGLAFELQHPLSPERAWKIIINPGESFHPLLWFIHALFIIFVLFPLLTHLCRRPWVVLLISLPLLYPRWPVWFSIRAVFQHLPLFTAGYMIGLKTDLDEIGKKPGAAGLILTSAIFVLLYLTRKKLGAIPFTGPYIRAALAFSGAFAYLFLSSLINGGWEPLKRTLSLVGFYSMSIYLLHTMFASFVRIFFYQIVKIEREFFLPVTLLAVLTGIAFPPLAEKHLFRKFRLTRKFILGLDKG